MSGTSNKPDEKVTPPSIPMTNEQRKGVQKDEYAVKKMQQLAGDLPTVEGNKINSIEIREDEQHLIHLSVIQKINNPDAKKYDSNKRVIKLGIPDYQRMDANGAFQVYDEVKLVHDPRSQAQIKAHEDRVGKLRKAKSGK